MEEAMSRRRLLIGGGVIVVVVAVILIVLYQRNQSFAVLTALPRQNSQVAFLAYAGTLEYGNLYVVNTDTGVITQITRGNAIRAAQWLADGERVQVGLVKRPNDDIYRLNVSTGELDGPLDDVTPELADDPQRESARQVSPDGQHLLIIEDIRDQWGGVVEQRLNVAESDGSNPRYLTNEVQLFMPVHWSPDGQHILYQNAGLVCQMDVNSGERDCPIQGNYPVWSPDGAWLAYGNWNPADETSQLCIAQWTEQRRCYGAFAGLVYPIGWRPETDSS
jgi:Tol biopolymer transport system component